MCYCQDTNLSTSKGVPTGTQTIVATVKTTETDTITCHCVWIEEQQNLYATCEPTLCSFNPTQKFEFTN